MSVLAVNLKHLYQRRGLWLIYALFGIVAFTLVKDPLMRMRTGHGDYIGCVLVIYSSLGGTGYRRGRSRGQVRAAYRGNRLRYIPGGWIPADVSSQHHMAYLPLLRGHHRCGFERSLGPADIPDKPLVRC